MYVGMCVTGLSWDSVTPLEVQFQDIVLEFQEYYNEKCTSHSRHYYYCTRSLQ